MTLADKISLVNQMIKENRDYTISDYLTMVRDVERVERSMYDHPNIGIEKYVEYLIKRRSA